MDEFANQFAQGTEQTEAETRGGAGRDDQAQDAEAETSGAETEQAPWPEAVADGIVDSIASVRQLLLRPVARIARRIVYGFVIVVLALLLFLVGTLGLIRLLDAYIPQEIWLTYAILGGVFTLVGLIIWSRRPRGAAS